MVNMNNHYGKHKLESQCYTTTHTRIAMIIKTEMINIGENMKKVEPLYFAIWDVK